MVFTEDDIMVNALARQILISAQEVMGENGLNNVLRTTGLERYINNLPPDDLKPAARTSEFARFYETIETSYGRGGRGMLRRIGKASFQYAIHDQSALLGLTGVAIKLLPEKQRLRRVLNNWINTLKKANPQIEAWVEDTDEGGLAYVERTCAVCYGRKSATPICYFINGAIAEAVNWATGVEREVHETHCLARGDEYCRFEINASSL